MHPPIPRRLFQVALAATLALPAVAELKLPAVLGSGMVLPRDRSVPLWGSATPGMPVSILTSWNPEAQTVLADSAGRWRAEVITGPAGGPHTVTITEPGQTVELTDVLLGEVWLCSGQSNMEWHYEWVRGAYERSATFDPERAKLTSDRVRILHVPQRMSLAPEGDCVATWRRCSPESAREFSAVAYHFARELEAALDVPIGVVGSYWGGTPVESWVSAPTITTFPRHAADLERIRAASGKDTTGALSEASAAWWTEAFLVVPESASYATEAFDDTSWTSVTVPAHWENGPLGDVDGIVWHRRVVELGEGFAGKDLELGLGPVDDDDLTIWNGTPVGSTGGWTATRTYTVPGALVKAGRNVLVVAVHDSAGAGGFHGDPASLYVVRADGPEGAAATRERVSLAGGEWRALRVDPPAGAYPRREGLAPSTPASLFNGMIAPLQPFRFSGVIWYQGESNRYDPALYRATFPALIQDWRKGFATPELPFLWAQIAPFGYGEGARGAHATALLREAQDRTLALRGTGQAILTDVGDVRDIHPTDKVTVAARLARLALAGVYGRELDPHGPRYAGHELQEGRVRVRFAHAKGGLVVRGDALTWFHVAGADMRFVPAVAVIEGETTVLVSSPEVAAPVAVRFGWSDIAEPNLFDIDGLPAAPFRTDGWDDVVIGE